MRIFLTISCCVGLALFAGAAQQDNNQNNQQYKKKGGGNAPQQQQVVTPQGGKKFKTGPGAGPHVQNFQQPNTVGGSNLNKTKFHKTVTGQTQTNASGNVSNNAANTKFNKSKFQGNAANATGGGGATKFQKQHFNLQTNKVVNKYKTVNFNNNYKIAGASKWKGPQYAVFVNYHPQWQSQWWWSSHYNHIVFIYGGWYYWNANYWYPAWGYAPDSVYYYDGPIYASSPQEDPAQVVANVQSALQQQGYYQGDIDGILGPQTRAALAEYQSAQGIEPTGVVDEPTLETLGMA
jgi:Putative peptidoglycan binding domain